MLDFDPSKSLVDLFKGESNRVSEEDCEESTENLLSEEYSAESETLVDVDMDANGNLNSKESSIKAIHIQKDAS